MLTCLRLLSGVGLLLLTPCLASLRPLSGLGAAAGFPSATSAARLGPALAGSASRCLALRSSCCRLTLTSSARSLSLPAAPAISTAAVAAPTIPATAARLSARPALPLSAFSRGYERC